MGADVTTTEAHERCHSFEDDEQTIRANLKHLCLQMLAANWQVRPTASTILTSEFLRVFTEMLIQSAPSLRQVLTRDLSSEEYCSSGLHQATSSSLRQASEQEEMVTSGVLSGFHDLPLPHESVSQSVEI